MDLERDRQAQPARGTCPPTAPESTKGFLLNHVISELLPPQPDGHRYANIDPVTGQAAWYDLKVRLRKCAPDEAGETAPGFDAA